ncbi:unnamed protein product [Gemmataceae bacterium]|nr:unnamed protein product [Gemmataceae bacterium]VTU00524.1 unnamed protein product [Gemmataceae bacterium]
MTRTMSRLMAVCRGTGAVFLFAGFVQMSCRLPWWLNWQP